MWNGLIRFILQSPLSGPLAKSMALVKFNGLKTAKPYSVPVNYLCTGRTIWVTSYKKRTWWRNLRGGRTTTLRVEGRDIPARAEVLENDDDVTQGLTAYLQAAPGYAKYFQVRLDTQGKPLQEDIQREATSRVIIRFTPLQ